MTQIPSRTTLGALVLSTLLCAPAFGQETGREGRLSYGAGLDFDLEDGLEVITDVAVTLITRTRASVLEFGVGTELFGDYTDGGTNDFDFRNSFARAAYSREGANSALNFTARYNERNLRDSVVGSVISDSGTETSTQFTGRIETGIEGPFGLTLDAFYRERDFTNADPDLIDDTQTSLDAVARFGVSRSFDLRALAGISTDDNDDTAGTKIESSYFGIGVATETARGLSVTGDILFDRTETSTTTPATSVTEDGIGFRLSANQDRPDGFVNLALSSRVDDAGRRTRAEVSRGFDMRTGGLEVSLGVVDQEGVGDLKIIGGLSYSVETPRSVFTADFEQDATTDDGDTQIDTTLRLAYRHEINAVSGLETELGYFQSNELAGTDDSRTTASVAYTRDLTEEWSMRTGYAYSRDDGSDPENSVFFNIERDIVFGF